METRKIEVVSIEKSRKQQAENAGFYEEAKLVCCRIAIVADEQPAKRTRLMALVRRAIELIASRAAAVLIGEVLDNLVRILRE